MRQGGRKLLCTERSACPLSSQGDGNTRGEPILIAGSTAETFEEGILAPVYSLFNTLNIGSTTS